MLIEVQECMTGYHGGGKGGGGENGTEAEQESMYGERMPYIHRHVVCVCVCDPLTAKSFMS